MDILKPELLWIGKRCYRVNPVANDDSTIKQAPVTSEYVEDGKVFLSFFSFQVNIPHGFL